MSRLLREARNVRGWSSAALRHEVTKAAGRLDVPVASDASLRVLISRWENGRAVPDPVNQMLLREVFGLDARSLGFPVEDELHGTDVAGLVGHAASRSAPSAAVIGYFDRQLDEHARLDNVAGPSFVLATAEAQLQQLDRLTGDGAREVARVTARFSEFTGWLQQDVGNDAEAVRLTARSVDLADLAGDPELSTYNRMRKANVLTGAGELHVAASTARGALQEATERFPHLAAVCLRQVALTSARLEDERSVRDALDRATASSAAGALSADGPSPYCTTSYVEMEAALCLLHLRQPAAAEAACSRALAGWPDDFARDRTLCLVRRGVALVELNEVEEACRSATLALDGVRSAPSGRAVHMLRLIAARLRPVSRNASVREFVDSLAEVA